MKHDDKHRDNCDSDHCGNEEASKIHVRIKQLETKPNADCGANILATHRDCLVHYNNKPAYRMERSSESHTTCFRKSFCPQALNIEASSIDAFAKAFTRLASYQPKPRPLPPRREHLLPRRYRGAEGGVKPTRISSSV
ncbi:hypothetical protein EYF80_033800 [Liparis tanakae]|uniref:Uncharacterized protein n=1 Tax=Liparis tanakae TaxID=230148 RepID=A0A4Z2GS66_9TELE|nr:hypothetical protein EYF80_033800 [Liparis tanakae]